MKVEATRSSEASLDFQRTTRRYLPENRARGIHGLSHSLHESAWGLLTLGDGRPITSLPCPYNQDM
jgi:hypothetical protein